MLGEDLSRLRLSRSVAQARLRVERRHTTPTGPFHTARPCPSVPLPCDGGGVSSWPGLRSRRAARPGRRGARPGGPAAAAVPPRVAALPPGPSCAALVGNQQAAGEGIEKEPVLTKVCAVNFSSKCFRNILKKRSISPNVKHPISLCFPPPFVCVLGLSFSILLFQGNYSDL